MTCVRGMIDCGVELRHVYHVFQGINMATRFAIQEVVVYKDAMSCR